MTSGRRKTCPTRWVKYIVDCCKMKEVPADIQQMIKQSMFN